MKCFASFRRYIFILIYTLNLVLYFFILSKNRRAVSHSAIRDSILFPVSLMMLCHRLVVQNRQQFILIKTGRTHLITTQHLIS